MRSQKEILDRIKEVASNDFFGYQRSDLMAHLDFENAKLFLKDEVTADQWVKESRSLKQTMVDYLPFAWEKANDKRGLSAGRSMEHYMTWLWLDGDEELHKTLSDYNYYGKPQLIEICKYLNVDPSQYDDGIRENE